eukprot:2800536-Rhodomonas_salina.2
MNSKDTRIGDKIITVMSGSGIKRLSFEGIPRVPGSTGYPGVENLPRVPTRVQAVPACGTIFCRYVFPRGRNTAINTNTDSEPRNPKCPPESINQAPRFWEVRLLALTAN